MLIEYKNHNIHLCGADNTEGKHYVYAYCEEDKTFPKVKIVMQILPESKYSDPSWKMLDEIGMYTEYSRNIKEHGPNEEQAALLDSLLAQCKF